MQPINKYLGVDFYHAAAHHYLRRHPRFFNLQKATEFNKLAFNLAESTDDIELQLLSLKTEAVIANRSRNPYWELQIAYKARRIGRFASNHSRFWQLYELAMSNFLVGNIAGAFDFSNEMEELLILSRMESSRDYLQCLYVRAQFHFQKSEYIEGRQLHVRIVNKTSPTRLPTLHAHSLASIAYLDVLTQGGVDQILANVSAARAVSATLGSSSINTMCSYVTAELSLSGGDTEAARSALAGCLSKVRGIRTDLSGLCLANLSDPKNGMYGPRDTFRWVMSYLGFTQKTKDPWGTLHALRRLGDLYTIMGDEGTALNVFHAVLEGATKLDIHLLRAECMVGIGDILNRRGESMQAKEIWAGAHPLFVRSSQMKDAAAVEKRLEQRTEPDHQFGQVNCQDGGID
jgi:hypothetical protein